MPLFLIASFENTSLVKPKLFLGPSISFLVSSKAEAEFDNGEPKEIDQKGFWKTTEFAIIAGAGIEYILGGNLVDLNILYQHGLTDLDNGVGGSRISSHTLAVAAGYAIKIL